ncbi:MAG: thioredoxin [Verrucomicrobiota bacterium]
MIPSISPNTFDQEVLQASHQQPVAVDFWAPWCGPCHMLTPTLEQTAVATQNFARITKVNVDDHPALAAAYGIRSLPTLLFFKNGQVYDRIHGVVDKELILNRLLEEATVPSDQQLATA